MKLGRRQRNKLLGMIRKHDDPILHTPCDEVTDFAEAAKIADEMVSVLKATHNGVGLAAPQIGYAKRIIVVRAKSCVGEYHVLVNPVIKKDAIFIDIDTGVEGCLSYHGVFVEIDRLKTVRVKWQDIYQWRRQDYWFGFNARVIQHECDHLDGICHVGDEWRRQQKVGAV